MPRDEEEAWERWRAAIERYQANPTDRNEAEMHRRGREFERVFCPEGADAENGKAA